MRYSYTHFLKTIFILALILVLIFALNACEIGEINSVKITFVQKEDGTINNTTSQSEPIHMSVTHANPALDNGYFDSEIKNRNLTLKSTEHSCNSIPVLVYHHILYNEEIPIEENEFVISVENFEQQMKFLKDNKYIAITLSELERFIKGEIILPEKSVLITFDDGYKSNCQYAYPIMKEFSLHGVIFLVSQWVQNCQQTFDPNMLQILDWSEIENSKDIFEYASHTHNLHFINSEKQSLLLSSPHKKIEEDLLKSKELLNTTSIAYPYGKYTEDTIQILKKLKFSMAFTVNDGDVKPNDDVYQLKRHTIYRSTTLEQFQKIIGME